MDNHTSVNNVILAIVNNLSYFNDITRIKFAIWVVN